MREFQGRESNVESHGGTLSTLNSRFSTLCRVLIDPEPGSGSWNMAVDEVLLEAAIREQRCTVRLYRWREATVSLGYFQEADAARSIPELASLPVVRRLSGGGAILHHHELTYSCALPATHALARSPHQLYERVHERIIAVLNLYRIAAQMRGKTPPRKDEPFLCFSRSDPLDIMFRGHKILGSAQRRRRGALLQHGSLLLKQSEHAPGHPGVQELALDTRVDDHLGEQIAAEVAGALGSGTVRTGLNKKEQQRAAAFERQRYQTVDWRRPVSASGRR